MDEVKVNAVWEAYFEADFRHRYFLALKNRFQRRIRFTSLAIALLSGGALANFAWESGFGPAFSMAGAVVAGILGIVLAQSNWATSLSTAVQAANEWGNAANKLHSLWVRAASGEDVYQQVVEIGDSMEFIDTVTRKDLEQDNDLINQAFSETEQALAA